MSENGRPLDWEDRAPYSGAALVHTFMVAGERIPPVHKPGKRSQCEWWVGIGWVHNPTGKPAR